MQLSKPKMKYLGRSLIQMSEHEHDSQCLVYTEADSSAVLMGKQRVHIHCDTTGEAVEPNTYEREEGMKGDY